MKELAEALHKHQLKAGKGFLFIPAYDCNFNCPYCYEAAISRNGTGWTKEVMTKEMVDAAYEAMHQLEPDVQRCKRITLYGGEPLLAENYEIVSYILEQGLKRGHTFSAITNGYELDAYWDFIGKGKIEFLQITLDGPPEVHDQRRRLQSGGGTFDRIAPNISRVLETGANVAVRINTDRQNIAHIGRLAEIFRMNKWTAKENFRAYTSPTHAGEREQEGDPDGSALRRCIDASALFQRGEFVAAVLEQKKHHEQLRTIGDNDFGIKRMIKAVLAKGMLMPFKSVFCGANVGMFIFDPRGDLYTCWEFVGQEHGKVGRYWPVWNIDEALLDQWRGRTVANIPKCRECKYALFCGGGCEAFAYRKHGCFLSSYCNDYPNIFAKFVAIAYKQFVQERPAATVSVDANNQITPPE